VTGNEPGKVQETLPTPGHSRGWLRASQLPVNETDAEIGPPGEALIVKEADAGPAASAATRKPK
jgi:hypothetical protein